MRMPIEHMRFEDLLASTLNEGNSLTPVEIGSLPQPANCSRTVPACLAARDSFKIFGDVGLYATLALISVAAGAVASASTATKKIGRRKRRAVQGRSYRSQSASKTN